MFSEMGRETERDSDDTAFQPAPFDVRASVESSRAVRVECEGARYAVILGLTSKPMSESKSLQSESLILAQNERWRQA